MKVGIHGRMQTEGNGKANHDGTLLDDISSVRTLKNSATKIGSLNKTHPLALRTMKPEKKRLSSRILRTSITSSGHESSDKEAETTHQNHCPLLPQLNLFLK